MLLDIILNSLNTDKETIKIFINSNIIYPIIFYFIVINIMIQIIVYFIYTSHINKS